MNRKAFNTLISSYYPLLTDNPTDTKAYLILFAIEFLHMALIEISSAIVSVYDIASFSRLVSTAYYLLLSLCSTGMVALITSHVLIIIASKRKKLKQFLRVYKYCYNIAHTILIYPIMKTAIVLITCSDGTNKIFNQCWSGIHFATVGLFCFLSLLTITSIILSMTFLNSNLFFNTSFNKKSYITIVTIVCKLVIACRNEFSFSYITEVIGCILIVLNVVGIILIMKLSTVKYYWIAMWYHILSTIVETSIVCKFRVLWLPEYK